MKFTLSRSLAVSCLLFVLSIASNGCQKNKDKPVEEPVPVVSKDLRIAFNSESIDVAKTDSIVINLVAEDKSIFRKKCLKKDGGFELALADITAGTWQMSAEVFTNEKVSGNRFTFSKSIRLPLTEVLEIKAPNNKLTDQWKIWFLEDLGEIKLYLPADPTDPAFEIEVKKAGWDFVYLERLLQVNNTNVTGADWTCDDNCFGEVLSVKNNTHFLDFTNRAKTTAWTSYEVLLQMVRLKDDTDITVYKRYTK